MGETKPYQFVGYWGGGIQAELESRFTKILSRARASSAQRYQDQLKTTENTDRIWGVAYISIRTERADFPNPNLYQKSEFTLASLSASGPIDQPDAWVKLQNNSLILGREPFGRIPLFWVQTEQIVWFASQLQLLLPLLENPQISLPGLYGYSCFSYVPSPLTPVENCYALPAGTELIFQQERATCGLTVSLRNRYQWQEAPELIKNENEAIAQLQNLLKNAINRQISDLNDQPVGIFLSGGIDSSIIAALLVQAGVRVRAYALDFEPILPNPRLSELTYAQQVAEHLKIPLVKVSVTAEKIKNSLISAAKALDLPFGDGAPLPLFLLSQVASQEVSIIFNGEQGDQLFAGWTNKPLIAAGIYNHENPSGRKNFEEQYLSTFQALSGYEAFCFQPHIYEQIQQLNPLDWLKEALEPHFCTHLFAKLRRASLMLKGAQNIQPRANNLALSQGLWVRSPFCDLPLAEWTFQLPGEFCLQGTCEKYILKRAVESWLPSEVVWREKQGMAVPVTSLCFNELRKEVRFWLKPSRLRAQGIWQPEFAEQLRKGQINGYIRGGKLGRILWLMMMWQVWKTAVFDRKEIHPSTFNFRELWEELIHFPPWRCQD